jgi:hypothetical protein
MNSTLSPSIEQPRTGTDRRFWVVLGILCAIGGAVAARRILDSGSTGLTLLHVVPSLMFVLLVPLQFMESLRRRYTGWHRWSGRLIMGLGAVIGGSALALSASPVGGAVEAAATTLFGSFFLLSLGKAWWHIRNRRIDLHREWGTRMVAIALGVATTRPIIGVFFATRRLTGLTQAQFFGPAMWLGFLSTWLAGEVWIRHTRSRPRRRF